MISVLLLHSWISVHTYTLYPPLNRTFREPFQIFELGTQTTRTRD